MPLPFAIRYVLSVALLIPAASFSATLGQNNPPKRPADADSPALIWDIDLKLAKNLPRNFRTTDDQLTANKGQKIPANTGLADLHASGSGEFTADGFKLLLGRTHGPATVFDLRQETHIFVNGLPVSWFATDDWANVGRSNNEIQADEAARVKSFERGSKIAVHPGGAIKKPGAASSAPEDVTVEDASTERDIVTANNAAYVRLALPENGWAHFHCEAGRGRTTTFMVLYDLLRNAKQVSLEDVARRQQLLGYDFDVLRPNNPEDWRAPYTADRIAFVRAFYEYARANPGGRPQLWSEWLKSRTD